MFRFIFSSLILILFLPNDLSAHSGRLDSNCGHNCSAESIRKGLCTSYHYHYANCPMTETLKVETETSVECNVLEQAIYPHSHDAEDENIATKEQHIQHVDASHPNKNS